MNNLESTYRIIAQRQIQGKTLIIHDWMSFPRAEPARNLFAYNVDGELLWRADDIGQGAADAYMSFLSEQPLRVWNFAGFICTIDINTGRIIEVEQRK